MLKEELDKLKRYAYSSVVVVSQDDAILSTGLLEDVIEETKELWNNDVLDSSETVVFDQKIAIITVLFLLEVSARADVYKTKVVCILE